MISLGHKGRNAESTKGCMEAIIDGKEFDTMKRLNKK